MGVFVVLGIVLCWVIVVRLFSGIGNVFLFFMMNFWKGFIFIFLFGLVLFFVLFMGLNVFIICWLLISGFIGIGIGDICFFKVLKSIGDS